jgi:hypothetical protein
MRISVKRIGGIAGVTEEIASVDTASLSPDAAQQVEQVVRESRFFELPARVSGATIGADQFQYQITIAEGSRQHVVTFDDESAETAPLRRLVAVLIQMRETERY